MSGIYRSAAGAEAVQRRYREILTSWPVPSEQLRIPTREGETFVVACGPPDAPPLLLLHGSSANSATWMGDVSSWARRFRVYAIDMIGEPGLSAPSRPDLASEAYAGWLDDVLAALAVERASIVGVSLGGWLALDYAIRRGDRVSRLALLCPAGIGRQRWGTLLAALLLRPFGRRGQLAGMRLILGADLPSEPAFIEYMMLVGRAFRPRMALPVFDDAALGRVRVPTLVVIGGRDRLLDSTATRRRVAQLVPGATIRVLPDAGHLLLGQTQPVLDFLTATEPSRPDPT